MEFVTIAPKRCIRDLAMRNDAHGLKAGGMHSGLLKIENWSLLCFYEKETPSMIYKPSQK
jgi:hypothetical protein